MKQECVVRVAEGDLGWFWKHSFDHIGEIKITLFSRQYYVDTFEKRVYLHFKGGNAPEASLKLHGFVCGDAYLPSCDSYVRVSYLFKNYFT